jgi:adenylate cyclase
VLAKRLAAGSLRGRVVLLGSSAPGLSDLRATPANGATPGVEVHANLLAGLLDGELPYRPSWASGYEALLLLLTLLSTGLLASWRSPPVALAGVAGLSALLLVSNASLYAQFKLVLPVASPLLLGTFFAAGLLARSYWLEWSERRSIVQLFDQYLPPERVKALVKEADPGLLQAENRELTLLFCDLQGFSALGERLPPLALRDLLNQFFSTATRIIHAEGGTLDKFIGDAVMAFWGAPQRQADHAERAVRAAVALKAAAGPLNASLAAQGLPSLKFGIGLATGVVCVGDLGSNLRRSYTAVGDAVNLAARIEALTREWGCGLLIADSTRQACGEAAQSWPWQEITQTQVRGRQQYVTLFTINDLPVALKPH